MVEKWIYHLVVSSYGGHGIHRDMDVKARPALMFPLYMCSYTHCFGNMSENCLSLCNVMHASVIIHNIVSGCS
jgi:hypothetical protein